MASDLQKGADGLVAALNGAGITYNGEALQVVWNWFPLWSLADLEELRVVVVPTARPARMISRLPSWNRHLRYSIGVWKRHGGQVGEIAPKDALNPLDDLTEEVFQFLQSQPLIQCDGFKLAVVEDDGRDNAFDNPVAMSDEMLEQARTFASVINLKYRKAP